MVANATSTNADSTVSEDEFDGRGIDNGAGAEFTVIDPVVQDALQKIENNQGSRKGKIADIASFNVSEPYSNFDIEKSRFLGESKQRIQKIIDEETYNDCILVAVELDTNHSKDVIVHPYTYEASNNETHESIVKLCNELNVDTSLVHHLIGESVTLRRDGNKWEIYSHKNHTRPSTVTARDFIAPIVFSSLPIPLGVAGAYELDYHIAIPIAGGVIASIILLFLTLWLFLAGKRDHPLPSVLGKLHRPAYLTDENTVENNAIIDVEQIELEKITTLADESEHDNDRIVLHNLALKGTIPHEGSVTIPLSSPQQVWHGSLAKHTLYYISPSIAELQNTYGDLVPIALMDDGTVKVSSDVIRDEPSEPTYRIEEIADFIVAHINWIFRTPTRESMYSVYIQTGNDTSTDVNMDVDINEDIDIQTDK